jgi:putative transposase
LLDRERTTRVRRRRQLAPIVESHIYFLRVLRYVVRNPVRAAYVRSPAEWPWSSYRASAGLMDVPPFLELEHLWNALDPSDRRIAQRQFVAFAAESTDDDMGIEPLLIGSREFITGFDATLQAYRYCEDHTRAERFAARPALTALLEGARPKRTLHRAVRTAFVEHAYTLREIGAFLDTGSATVWSWIQRAEWDYTRDGSAAHSD